MAYKFTSEYKLTDVATGKVLFATKHRGSLGNVVMPSDQLMPGKQYRLDVFYTTEDPDLLRMQPDGQVASVTFTTDNSVNPLLDQIDLSAYIKKDELVTMLDTLTGLTNYPTKDEVNLIIDNKIKNLGSTTGSGSSTGGTAVDPNGVYSIRQINQIVDSLRQDIASISYDELGNKFLLKSATAADSQKLGGVEASEYVRKNNLVDAYSKYESNLRFIRKADGVSYAQNAGKLDGRPASDFMLTTDRVEHAKNSDRLGDAPADDYVKKSDLTSKVETLINQTTSFMFTTTAPINNPIGSFDQGESVSVNNNMTMVEAINKILHKYVEPKLTISITPDEPLYEKNKKVPNVNIRADIVKGTADILRAKLSSNGNEIAYSSTIKDGGNLTAVLENLLDNQEILLEVTDTEKVTKITKSIRFVHRQYFGVVAHDTPIIEANVKSLGTRLAIGRRLTTDFTNVNNGKIVYSYPTSLGRLESIKDANGFEYLTEYDTYDFAVSGVPYHTYYLKVPVSGTLFTMTFK